jgi:hypothetical protein
LKQQQRNIGGGFGGQWVGGVALVEALAMALGEQWQQWVRHQSTKKTTINQQRERQRWAVAGKKSVNEHMTTMAGNDK